VTVLLKDIKKLGGKEGRIEEAEQRDMGIHEQHDGIGFATKGNNTPGANGMVGGSTPMGAGNNTPGGAFSFQETPLPQRQDAFAEQDYQVQMHQDDTDRRRDQEDADRRGDHQDQEHAYYDQQQQQQQHYPQQQQQQQHQPPQPPPPQPHQPHEQSAAEEEGTATTLMENWVKERAVVRVKKQGEHYFRSGVVTSISSTRMCSIDVTEPTPVGIIEVSESSVEPVRPQKGDHVLIVGHDVDEEMLGKIGTLNNIDDTDAVVTVNELGLQFFDMGDLCKLIPK
jgi:hypothetical protein